jgi:hypothetical protein
MTNLQKLASNTGCFVNYDIGTGLWGVTINRDSSPTLAFDDSNIISGIDLTGTNLDNMFNAVEVEFPHRQLRDQIDSIRIDLPTEYRNSNEPDNVLKIRLDLLNEPLQARELGYLELYQNRMDQVITFTSDYSKINTEAGDIITVTSAVYGWSVQPFRVVRVREVEGDEGGLAVEITAQEYDATMYTAGGQPRRPRVPSDAIGIPGIAVIGIPDIPTVTLINLVAVPAIDVTGLTPSGIVDRFEYWYSSDAGATYKLLGTRRNSNGSPYNEDTSLTFRAAELVAGTYLFKVRGGNATVFGPFSTATAGIVWAPVQVTDAVSDTTQVTGSMADLIGPLAMGAIAYFAYQQLYPEIMGALGDSELGEIFGIPSSAVQTMQNASGNFKIIQVGDTIQTPYTNDTITFIAGDGITITAEADAGTITINSVGAVTGVINDLNDVDTVTKPPAVDAVLKWDGNNWIPSIIDTNPSGGGDPASINVDFGSELDFIMDTCQQLSPNPIRIKRLGGTYQVPRKYITAGGTKTLTCYATSMPTLSIPGHGTPIAEVRPFSKGSFLLYAPSYPAVHLKTINYNVINGTEVVAYCNFNDDGTPITGGNYCSTMPPTSRPVFSTVEFPAGNRFVTFAMIQGWTPIEGGKYPINNVQYTTLPTEYYAQTYSVVQYPRLCRNSNGAAVNYDFS